MNVFRMMVLYMDYVICLFLLKEVGVFFIVKYRYILNKSMSILIEKENKMFNKK